jgi:SAM-dependent methyltransferase
MDIIDENCVVSLEFELTWKSGVGNHREIFFAHSVRSLRDLLPEKVARGLIGKSPGEPIHLSFSSGELGPRYDSHQVLTLEDRQFERRQSNEHRIEPRFGRFYPKGLLKDLANIYSENIAPFRCIGIEPPSLTVDFNHPLAKTEMELQINVHDVRGKESDRGGRVTDWTQVITDGPGMQARWQGRPTDFFSDNPFARSDEENDLTFYKKPRLVTHIDSTAEAKITALYGALLNPGMQVLDLMGSWQSHIPESLALASLVGLGLNREEMEKNSQCTRYVIHDLNEDPGLPFDNQTFDAVICTVAVEYMTCPLDVFQAVARLLRAGGFFIHTFSNRWFPPKVVNIWKDLSEFERMGLVLEYFLQSKAYENLQTYSSRGYPRPATDRYYPNIITSDPVYAVWGQAAA